MFIGQLNDSMVKRVLCKVVMNVWNDTRWHTGSHLKNFIINLLMNFIMNSFKVF